MLVRISLLAFILVAPHSAHEIPSDVTARLRVEQTQAKLTITARVPLKAMRDVDFPEQPGGYLNVPLLTPRLPDIATTWVASAIELRGATRPRVVATRLAIESDPTFDTWRGQPQTDLGLVVWGQLWLDILMESTQRSPGPIILRPGLHGLGRQVLTIVHFRDRAFELHGDPGFIELDPSWTNATRRFSVNGFWHILEGLDHLLFLACLVLPVRNLRSLVWIITAFTAGHSITLIAAALGLAPNPLWFPPAVEVAIAATILITSLANLSTFNARTPVAFVFGLIHGFGFSFALKETLQFAGSHLLTALLAFNVGVEVGQLAVVGCLWLALRYIPLNRTAEIILNAFIAHTAWHWLLERFEILRKF